MFFSSLILCLLATGAAWAEPITVDAATLDVRHLEGKATFGGGVTVTQGDTVLTAPTMLVTYGKKGQGGVKDIVTQGRTHVTRKTSDGVETADADAATYVPDSQLLTLIGNVQLTQGGNTLRGSKLVYDVKSGKISLGGGGGVSGRFETK